MAINQLSSANTFQHWLIATQQLITLANNLTDGGIVSEFPLNTSIYIAGTLRTNVITANVISTDILYANLAVIDVANIEFAKINVAHINVANLDVANINVANINVAKIKSANINTINFLDGTSLNSTIYITQSINTAISTSGQAYNHANGAFDKANDAYLLAGNAYDAANNLFNVAIGAANSVGAIFTENNLTSTSLYPVMVGGAGTLTTPNVSINKLSFNALEGIFSVSGYYLATGATGGFYLASRTGGTSPRYSLYTINNNFYVYDHTTSSNRITVKSDGTIGIGVDNPDSTVKIDSYGPIRASHSSGSSNHIGMSHNLTTGLLYSSSNITIQSNGSGSNVSLLANASGHCLMQGGNILMQAGSGNITLQTGSATGNILFNTNNTQKAKISATGGFSVGTNDSPAAGGIFATGSITSNYSDERLKNKLGNIENAIDKVCSLNGFYYEPNKIAEDLGYEKERQVGVSAQEVHKILPEAVCPAPIDSQYLTVHYERLVPLLIEAIKELKQEVLELKQKLQE